ncbi:MAG: ATP-grasp domain-containing protein [Nitrospinota bacterium]|nr:ATP-grasp domain-containing protein [Nitrospinota bacterium]
MVSITESVYINEPKKWRLEILKINFIGGRVRPFAELACTFGYKVGAFDLFNDWDLAKFIIDGSAITGKETREPSYSKPSCWNDIRHEYKKFDMGPIIFCGPIEATPEVAEEASRTREVWNAPPDAMRRCRDIRFLRSMASGGILYPSNDFDGSGRWIRKDLYGAGGTSVSDYKGEKLHGSEYTQRYIQGGSIGATYFTSAGGTSLLGVTRHLNGYVAFRQPEFSFGGILYPAVIDDDADVMLEEFGKLAGDASGLRGFWGADFILGVDKRIWLLEINPRPTASLELIAKEHGIDIVSLQGESVRGGKDKHERLVQKPGRFSGTAVCYAEDDLIFASPGIWFEKGGRDLPYHGEAVKKGEPVLSLYAESGSAEGVMQKMEKLAAEFYRKEVQF